MIKNVILDMGNVLLDYNPEVPLNMFCDCEEAKDIIRNELFHGPEWVMGDRGDIPDKGRYELVKQRVPEKYWDALKQCCDRWYICMNPIQGAAEFCSFVREQGLGIYILSNASDAFYEYFPKFLPLTFFDGVVVSADIHMLKPDPEIYTYLTDKYGLEPSECLFIDDMPQNVQGAKQAGLQAVRFENDYDTVRQLILREKGE